MATRKRITSRERWKPVTGYEGLYEVSSLGRVRRLARQDAVGRRLKAMPMKLTPHSGGYWYVGLSRGGKARPHLVHSLVAWAFLGAPPGKQGTGSDDYQVNHRDGDKRNNQVGNLEWIQHRANHEHAARLGLTARGEAVNAGGLTDRLAQAIRALSKAGFSTGEIRRLLRLRYGTVWRVVKKKTWRHLG